MVLNFLQGDVGRYRSGDERGSFDLFGFREEGEKKDKAEKKRRKMIINKILELSHILSLSPENWIADGRLTINQTPPYMSVPIGNDMPF